MLNLLAVCNVYWLVHYKSYVKIACDVKGIYIFYNFSTLPVPMLRVCKLYSRMRLRLVSKIMVWKLVLFGFENLLVEYEKKKKLEKTVSTGPSLNSKLLIQKSGGE